jgi:hypothetical protein
VPNILSGKERDQPGKIKLAGDLIHDIYCLVCKVVEGGEEDVGQPALPTGSS